MTTYQKKSIQVNAKQFTGNNWAEMHDFTGHFEHPDLGPLDVFESIVGGPEDPRAHVWVAANKAWLDIEVGEWVIKDKLGFYPHKDGLFQENYTEVAEPSTDEPTEVGFYYNDGAAQTMIYLLDGRGQWWAITDSLEMTKCVWEYIEQTVTTYPLKKLGD